MWTLGCLPAILTAAPPTRGAECGVRVCTCVHMCARVCVCAKAHLVQIHRLNDKWPMQGENPGGLFFGLHLSLSLAVSLLLMLRMELRAWCFLTEAHP